MVKQDIGAFTQKSPQYLQSDQQGGAMKGYVVDVRDPYMRGRVRVWCYGAQGDLPDLDIYTLIWAEPMWPRGMFAPPELGDRVMITYENGDKESPVYFGTWNATPMEQGKLPWSKRKGSEIDPAGWHARGLYPESTVVGSSRNGNVISMQDIYMSGKDLAASINLQDVSGRFMRVWSINLEVDQVWSKEDEFEGEKAGQLMEADIGENIRLRKGYESYQSEDIEEAFGAVEFGYRDVTRSIVQGKEDFSLDQVVQKNTDDELGRDQRSVSGAVFFSAVKSSSVSMLGGAMALVAPAGTFVPQLLAPPRRWDDDDEEQGALTPEN